MKNVTIQIKDGAENYCLKNDYEILYDPEYEPGQVQIKGDPIWTDDTEVTINVAQDHLPSDEMEMYIFGGVDDADNTLQWIPYTEEDVTVPLAPVDGHRWVRVKFRKTA